jgi:hypothetical protein
VGEEDLRQEPDRPNLVLVVVDTTPVPTASPPDAPPALDLTDPKLREQLRALGYLE